MSGSQPGLDPNLLEILVCPACRSELVAEPTPEAATALRCASPTCGLVYPVRDGIPVLLIDEATSGRSEDGGAGPE